MENILRKIVAAKKLEVEVLKHEKPLNALMNSGYIYKGASLKKYLTGPGETGIIAEFKRSSPSKGIINIKSDIIQTTTGYIRSGATALSVLTEKNYFGGSTDDLITVRAANSCPILRKEFIIDEYQLFESKMIGADAILLIASILTPDESYKLAKKAKELGLEVILEIHSYEELNRINDNVDIVGVNNRNLKDFSLSLNTSLELFDMIPDNFVKISESGIDTPERLLMLKRKGFQGFLIGERFMSYEFPEKACEDFIFKLRSLNMELKESVHEN